MRIVFGHGRDRTVTELPCAEVRRQDEQSLRLLTQNIQDRVCSPKYALERKGFKVYQ